MRIHPDGSIWSTGAMTLLRSKDLDLHPHQEVPTSYGIALDPKGKVWFTEMTKNGAIGKVDPRLLKVTKYMPPTRRAAAAHPGRQQGHGVVCRIHRSKIGRL